LLWLPGIPRIEREESEVQENRQRRRLEPKLGCAGMAAIGQSSVVLLPPPGTGAAADSDRSRGRN